MALKKKNLNQNWTKEKVDSTMKMCMRNTLFRFWKNAHKGPAFQNLPKIKTILTVRESVQWDARSTF